MPIDGRTKVLVHLSYPSKHLKTPALFNARCAERGINAVLVPWQVSSDDLGAHIAMLRSAQSVAGMIVTIPHKETAARHCDVLEGVAADLLVTNVIRRGEDMSLTGRMLDGIGFVMGLNDKGLNPRGKKTLLVGAGGVAIAIAEALLRADISELVIANRTSAKAEVLVARLTALYPGTPIKVGPANAESFDLVVNGTALGMKPGDLLPVDIETIGKGTVVAEVIMEPARTSLLNEAKKRGAIIHEGSHMLRGQIDAFIDFVLMDPSSPDLTPNS
ncbi:shikimate dehydrogenase family protein [Ochrobactrum sp. EDr1-4]|uniref:shikimate dehydrogenase family protein n=1 Tax=Ochrobactrum sp. EDr1-4 TaxID=3368622 RepID=UPI003BA0C914